MTVLKFPKTDGAVWKALNKYKKKSDLEFIWIQKSLVKAASATLNLNDKVLKALGKAKYYCKRGRRNKRYESRNSAEYSRHNGFARVCIKLNYLKKEDCLKGKLRSQNKFSSNERA